MPQVRVRTQNPMNTKTRTNHIVIVAALSLAVGTGALVRAQDAGPAGNAQDRGGGAGPRGGGGGPGGFGGFGRGPGGPMREERKLVKQFDKDNDGRLNKDERTAARAFLKTQPARGPGGRGRGFGAGGFVAELWMNQADKDANQKLTKEELTALAGAWFDKLDATKSGKLAEQDFVDRFGEVMPPPDGFRPPDGGGPPGDRPPGDRPPGDGPDGRGPGRGGRLFGPGQVIGPAVFAAADTDKDKSITRDELAAALGKWAVDWDANKDASLTADELREGLSAVLPRPQFGGPGGPGGPGGRANREPPKPGPKVAPADVKSFHDSSLFEPTILRTLFLDFEGSDWEAELSEFRDSDVEVPATLAVDGKTYPNVGTKFRGMSSLMGVGDGFKRSLNLSLDFADKKQRLYGQKTLNLLNAHEDPTFLHTVLYFDIARRYIPAPRANLVKVVINGESWGVYVAAEQFNSDFVKDRFGDAGGNRWKVQGSPGGRGGLEFLGEDAEAYKRIYTIKSTDDPKAWKDLIHLCKVLNETPADKLEAALEPILDVEGVLWFLAIENAFINSDGYWTRASDFHIYQDKKGKFHVIPHDANETFGPGMGPGMGGRGRGGPPGGPGSAGVGGREGRPRDDGPPQGRPRDDAPRDVFIGGPVMRPFGGGGAGVELDPLVGMDDNTKPLRSKLLAVPALKARYLEKVRTLATDWLDWEKLSPVVNQYRALIEKEVEADTRKLEESEAFARAIDGGAEEPQQAAESRGPGPRGRRISLRQFAQQRRQFLLNHAEIKKLAEQPAEKKEPAANAALPQKPADLYQETKVWTVHLKFTPEQFAAMEPQGGGGPFGGPGPGGPRGPGGAGGAGQRPGGGGFGPGMFLAPAFLQQADTGGDKQLSREEFGALAQKWFATWDKDNAGKVNGEQLREGLNKTFAPPPGPGGPGGPGAGRPPNMNLQGPEGRRNGLASAVGIEFKYVRADLEFEGQTLKDVAVRYKGNGTFLQSRASLKRSLKLDLNDHVKDQSLAGVTKLNLHNCVTDGGWMNEVLSHRLFRDAGVPAARTAYARVYLTVPGKHERQYVGLYSMVENIDDEFAAERFGTTKGEIFKPVTPSLFAYLGDDWAKYKQTYDPKGKTDKNDEQRVINFAKLVTSADDAEFTARVGEFLDLDELSRFMAVTVWLSTMDSILGVGQNYYVYLHPETKKFQFLPWDLDHSFGQFFLMGSQSQRENLSVRRPWQGENRFLERVFKLEAFQSLYQARLKEFSETVFRPERFHQQVDAIAAAIRPAVKEEGADKLARFEKVVAGEPVEPAGFGPPGGGRGGPPMMFPAMPAPKPIKPFVMARAAAVMDQLAGKSQGEQPGGFGPPGGGGPGGRGAGNFGPGTFLAPAFTTSFDADKDGNLKKEEVVSGFARWFNAWDGDKGGALSEDELRAGINEEFSPFRAGPPRGP